jgi:aralkylamine N-acetyltransferase
MVSLSEVRFQFHSEGVDWQELLALFKRTNLVGREGDKVRRAFERSSLVCFATHGSRLIAAGRAFSARIMVSRFDFAGGVVITDEAR